MLLWIEVGRFWSLLLHDVAHGECMEILCNDVTGTSVTIHCCSSHACVEAYQFALKFFIVFFFVFEEAMAVPLLTKKIVKKRVKKFKRPQSDWKISVKVWFLFVHLYMQILKIRCS